MNTAKEIWEEGIGVDSDRPGDATSPTIYKQPPSCRDSLNSGSPPRSNGSARPTMGKLLLTNSQVSILLSSSIIVTFTFLLFLAGYVLQQQSLDRINASLRPLQPSPRHRAANPTTARPDARSRLSRPLGRLREQLHWTQPSKFNWSKYAHAQLARESEELCHALIVLHELNRLQSPAPRLLMFPRQWLEDHDQAIVAPNTDTEIRIQLLKKASRSYRAILVPIDPPKDGANVTEPTSYSILSAFSLTNYDRVMLLPTPSLLFDTRKLDSMLAFLEPNDIASFPPLQSTNLASRSSMLLLRPSKHIFKALAEKWVASSADDSLLQSSFDTQETLLSAEDPDFQPSMYTTLQDMRIPVEEGGVFNMTTFMENTALVTLQDEELPGPQYDMPYHMIVSHRPADEDQGFVWEKVYSTYKDRRYRVCGMELLDLKQEGGDKAEL